MKITENERKETGKGERTENECKTRKRVTEKCSREITTTNTVIKRGRERESMNAVKNWADVKKY